MPPNVRTWGFKKQFGKLPARIREVAELAFRQFVEDPQHPGLGVHALDDSKKGQHRSGSVSVRVTARYRAIYTVDGGVNVWYWIGSHEDYNSFTGRK